MSFCWSLERASRIKALSQLHLDGAQHPAYLTSAPKTPTVCAPFRMSQFIKWEAYANSSLIGASHTAPRCLHRSEVGNENAPSTACAPKQARVRQQAHKKHGLRVEACKHQQKPTTYTVIFIHIHGKTPPGSTVCATFLAAAPLHPLSWHVTHRLIASEHFKVFRKKKKHMRFGQISQFSQNMT